MIAPTCARLRRASFTVDSPTAQPGTNLIPPFLAHPNDASALKKPFKVHHAPVVQPFVAKSAGKVKKMDAETIGRISLLLGGGRQTADDTIDFAVGLSSIKKIGERVEMGERPLTVHARTDQTLRSALPLLESAVTIR